MYTAEEHAPSLPPLPLFTNNNDDYITRALRVQMLAAAAEVAAAVAAEAATAPLVAAAWCAVHLGPLKCARSCMRARALCNNNGNGGREISYTRGPTHPPP